MKFIRFKADRIKKEELDVYNHKGEYLGWIEFKGDWKTHKQFIFCPMPDMFFTKGCLHEIVQKLQEMNKFENYKSECDS